MAQDRLRWGIVSTIKAPLREIVDFAAHHLDLGAHRLIIYLDDDNPAAFEALKQHPKIRVFKADADHWRSPNRPAKHQARQTANARHAYTRKAADIDWIAHIDVDEFLWPHKPLEDQLQALPADCLCARIRPIEALSSDGIDDIPAAHTCFKAMTNDRTTRQRQTEAIFPTYGGFLNGGFLSHVAGKLFFRTGIEGLTMKIHNIHLGEEQNPGQVELDQTELCHMHAQSWHDFITSYRYRLERGSYRPDLAPNRARDTGGMSMHELFTFIENTEGEPGLRAFYDETCRATPALRARLDAHGLLRCYDLGLDAKRARHFPWLA
ncbi:glycosyltransferase family 2 protein [Aquicoccus porphyridii]|uniref:glycosyltransferase family 2 protein n=1 Tax=Aquicoccus porphyridii TaxID=1852029 RepID=UPI00273D9C9F|nr:glycosyltransferase family 2 protein [Aquicoccus porphyridii]